jgi:hypothetical protein
MPWRDFFKRKQSTQAAEPPTVQTGAAVVGRPAARRAAEPDDPQARERRRQRLERRIQDLRYDVGLAESATRSENRWTERIEQLNQAIEQAQCDAQAALSAPPDQPGIPLPPLPVIVERVEPGEPAEIVFRVGDETFRYAEDLDWAERGHQKAEAQLQRVEGDVDAIMPPTIPPERRAELREHLAHGLSTLADELRAAALDKRPLPAYTLADLARPCPECGGWRDLKGRCPACQQRQWQADHLRAEADRLLKERNDQFEEQRRWTERLPVLRRQLAEAEAATSPPGPLS